MKTKNKSQYNHKNQRMFIFIICAFVLLWSTVLAFNHRLMGWEKDLTLNIYNLGDWLRWPMYIITLLGGAVATAVFVVWFFWRYGWDLALRFVGASTVSFIVVSILKNWVERARPFNLLDITSRDYGTVGLGFPSGHSAQIAVTAIFFSRVLPKKWSWLLFFIAFLVVVSRIYLGLHAPLDVLGGLAIGIIIGELFAPVEPLKKH